MRRLGVALLTALALTGCADGNDGGSDAQPPPSDTVSAGRSTTSTTLDFGDLALEVPDGFIPIPVPDAGFGLAIPEGFQATLLTPEAIERLQQVGVTDTDFVAAAVVVAESGALLYAAGVGTDGTVTDVKLDVEFTGDPTGVLQQTVLRIAAQPGLEDVATEVAADNLRARITFSIPGPDPAGPRARGTQFVFGAPDAVWSLIITSEDAARHDEIADAIGESFVLATSS